MSTPLEPRRRPPSAAPWIALAAGVGVLGFGIWTVSRRRDPEAEAIQELADGLEGEGAIVFTDLAGSPRPPKIGGHIPDVYAAFVDGGELTIEVENERSVKRSHARHQDRAFRKWADEGDDRVYEQIVIKGGRGGRK